MSKLWLVYVNDKLQGPFTIGQLKVLFDRRSVRWMDLVREDTKLGVSEEPKWLRLGELLCAELAEIPEESAPPTIPHHEEPVFSEIWFLQFGQAVLGPLNLSEAEAFLRSGTPSDRVYAWRVGMNDWAEIQRVGELSSVYESIAKRISFNNDNSYIGIRGFERIPLLATVMFTTSTDPSGFMRKAGICRNFSISGMTIWSSEAPGPINCQAKLEVRPALSSGLAHFEVEAIVCQVLPAGNGFAVEFKNVAPAVRRQIESYLKGSRNYRGQMPPPPMRW
jgi:hypothetical protein